MKATCLTLAAALALGIAADSGDRVTIHEYPGAPASDPEALEERLRLDPHDREARVGLVGHYWRHRLSDRDLSRRHAEHVVWLVEHAPREPVLGRSVGQIRAHANPEAYARAKTLWLGHVERTPGDARLLGNAARFLDLEDRELATSLLESALESDPRNPGWAFEVGFQHWLAAGPDAPADDPQLSLAVDHFERAYELAGTGDSRRQTYAVHAMRGAFAAGRHADARHYAERVLDACGACDGWRRADALHQVNVVLGRVALAEADVARAREHLLAAGRVEGSPGLGSFGPNMALAKELLERGERDAVLEYFGLCRRFWDRKRLGVWAGVVRAGRIPDFGSNLDY